MGGFLPVPEKVAFTVFGIDILWYGVMVTLGIFAAGLMFVLRRNKCDFTEDNSLDMLLWAVPVGVVGARAYYVIFSWDYYSQHPDQILNTRGGGLAIHGGLIFGVLTAFILVRFIWKKDFLKVMDAAAPCIAIGQAIGRWGNYFNSEAHGGPTNLPWAIEAEGQLVHPTFLYESIWCLLLCIFLLWFEKKGYKDFNSQLFLMYAMLYSAERAFVEGLRTDSLMIGPFRQAQVLSAAVIAAALVMWLIESKRQCKCAAAENTENEIIEEE